VWVETDRACTVEVRRADSSRAPWTRASAATSAASAEASEASAEASEAKLGHREPTFCVAGHHYALVVVRGLFYVYRNTPARTR